MTQAMIQAIEHLSTTPHPEPVTLERQVYWTAADIARRSYYGQFMGIIVFPLILTMIIAIVLSCAMFGRREGV